MNFKSLSRKRAEHIIKNYNITVNGKRVRKGFLLKDGDIVNLDDSIPVDLTVKPNADIKLQIIFLNNNLIAVNKPAGIHSHPLKSEETTTVLNGVIALFPEVAHVKSGSLSPGLLHRLDKETSGVLLIARNQETYELLRKSWQEKKIKKEYTCLVHGALKRELTIEGYLSHKEKRGQKMSLFPEKTKNRKSWYSKSTVKPVEEFNNFTLVKVVTFTGVTHQVRVHLASCGFPVAGDILYGGEKSFTELEHRFFLHASRIELPEILNTKGASISAPLTRDLQKILEKLRSAD